MKDFIATAIYLYDVYNILFDTDVFEIKSAVELQMSTYKKRVLGNCYGIIRSTQNPNRKKGTLVRATHIDYSKGVFHHIITILKKNYFVGDNDGEFAINMTLAELSANDDYITYENNGIKKTQAGTINDLKLYSRYKNNETDWGKYFRKVALWIPWDLGLLVE